MTAASRWKWAASALLFALLMSACAAQRAAPSATRATEGGAVPPASAPVAPSSSQGGGTANDKLPSDQAVLGDRKIIYTGSMVLEVKDTMDAINRITQLANSLNGYVANSSVNVSDNQQIGSISIRVPSQSYQDAITQLRAIGTKVREEKTASQDVSEEYADLSAQLRNLQASEAQYLEFMKRANTIDEVLKVQQQLTAVRGQIERIQGRINYLDRRADMATITLSLVPPSAGTHQPGDLSNPIDAAIEAWYASLQFLSYAASLAVTIIVFFWWAIPPLALLVLWIMMRVRRRRAPSTPSAPAAA